ncbi:MAG: hypothetical protein U0556_03630 [Dehalococcoidia bacterium]
MRPDAGLSGPWIVREAHFGPRVIVVGIAGDIFGFELLREPGGSDARAIPFKRVRMFATLDEARAWMGDGAR